MRSTNGGGDQSPTETYLHRKGHVRGCSGGNEESGVDPRDVRSVERRTRGLGAGVSARTCAAARHGTTVKWSSPSATACARRKRDGRAGYGRQTTIPCGCEKQEVRAGGETACVTVDARASSHILRSCVVSCRRSCCEPIRGRHVEGLLDRCSPVHITRKGRRDRAAQLRDVPGSSVSTLLIPVA